MTGAPQVTWDQPQLLSGKSISAIPDVLDTDMMTIIHRGSTEAYGDKNAEVSRIIDAIGEHTGRDADTGFDRAGNLTGRS